MYSRIIKGHKHPVLTLEKFQNIKAIFADVNTDEDDKLLYAVCALYDIAPEVLNVTEPKKALKMIARVKDAFNFKVKDRPHKAGKYKVNYDIESITFGAYIELAYFSQFDSADRAHFILASVTKGGEHKDRAAYFLKQPMINVMGALRYIIDGFNALNKKFGTLFDLDPDVNVKAFDNSYMAWFNKRYGWLFSAESVARYNNITIDEAYRLNIKRALNDLAYLKAKEKYLFLLNKK